MAHVGGPSSYLPGQKIFLPLGVCCDEHTEIKAVARIVGETDSMGYEALDMCQECYDNYLNEDKLQEGICDWCKSSDKDLKHKRDPDEGSYGRVYLVCTSCIKSESEAQANESESDEDSPSTFNDDYFDSDSDDKTD